jgi:hypothetical protein
MVQCVNWLLCKFDGSQQGATMCFDIDSKDSSPTWALRNQPTPPVGNLYLKTLMYQVPNIGTST